MDIEHEQDQAPSGPSGPSDQVTERRDWKSYWKQQLFNEIILSNMFPQSFASAGKNFSSVRPFLRQAGDFQSELQE